MSAVEKARAKLDEFKQTRDIKAWRATERWVGKAYDAAMQTNDHATLDALTEIVNEMQQIAEA